MTLNTLIIHGSGLSLEQLIEWVYSESIQVQLDETGLRRMDQARELIDAAIDEGKSMYGLTTGLGAKVKHTLTRPEISEFTINMIRGRAHSMGHPLARNYVRAAMLIRLNTWLSGRTTASQALARYYVHCLNEDLIPVVGEFGSIGAGDLCWGASHALALLGEGQFLTAQGATVDSDSILQQKGIEPIQLQGGEGMTLMNHGSLSTGIAAIGLGGAIDYMTVMNRCLSLSLEAFKANLSPMRIVLNEDLKKNGEVTFAETMMGLLQGSDLLEDGAARRLQDPISIRNIVQTHGALQGQIQAAKVVMDQALNAVTDNPQLDIENKSVLSSGAYQTTDLTLSCDSVKTSLRHVCVLQVARISKFLDSRYSGLSDFLASDNATSNAFAPVMKLVESLLAEVMAHSSPTPVWPSVNANGVEDGLTNTPQAAKSLNHCVELAMRLCVIEMMVACQALEMREQPESIPNAVKELVQTIRESVKPFDGDRSLTGEMEALFSQLFGNKV